MELTRHVKYIILFIVGLIIVLLYLLLTDQYQPLLQLVNIQLIVHRPIDLLEENLTLTNDNRSDAPFQSRLSSWYPHLPIHMFTQDLSSLTNTTKLILIGNGFFGDRNWGIAVSGRSSAEISKRTSSSSNNSFPQLNFFDFSDFSTMSIPR